MITISACATKNSSDKKTQHQANTEIPINNQLFFNDETALNIQDDMFTLTLAQQQTVVSAVRKKQQRGVKLHQALYDVLKDKLSSFTYYGENYNAEQAMRLNKGNCMTLAVLTTAYAKLLGLEFSYRKVNSLPIFKKQNNLIISSSHVQTIIYDNEFSKNDSAFYIRKPGLVIDYFPDSNNRAGKYLNESDFISMYYKNLAGDALVDDDLPTAFVLAKEAYKHNKHNVEAINLLAIIHRRAGDSAGAEAIYKAGLNLEQKNLRLLSNYIMLLKTENRFDEAEQYQKKLSHLDDPNPFNWLEQAYVAEKNHKINRAIRYYQKALTKAPYLNQAYLGLYHIYHKKGYYAKARGMLKKALEWTYEIEQRKQYKHKLYNLAQSF